MFVGHLFAVVSFILNWSLTLSERHRLMLFENKVQRRIFGFKRGEVAGRRRKLRNEDRNNLLYPLNTIRMIQSRKMCCGGACISQREGEKCMQIFNQKIQSEQFAW